MTELALQTYPSRARARGTSQGRRRGIASNRGPSAEPQGCGGGGRASASLRPPPPRLVGDDSSSQTPRRSPATSRPQHRDRGERRTTRRNPPPRLSAPRAWQSPTILRMHVARTSHTACATSSLKLLSSFRAWERQAFARSAHSERNLSTLHCTAESSSVGRRGCICTRPRKNIPWRNSAYHSRTRRSRVRLSRASAWRPVWCAR